MTTYICEDCGEVFTEDTASTRKDEFGNDEMYCPHCGSYSIEEATECKVCGEYACAGLRSLCEDCKKKYVTLENALEFGKECIEEVKLNGFLASMYTPIQIETLLMRDLAECLKLQPKTVKDSVENYCAGGWDDEVFADFINEKITKGELK